MSPGPHTAPDSAATDGGSRPERWTGWLLAVVFALLFGLPLLFNPDRLGLGDWDYFTSWSLAERTSLLQYGRWPSWSPWHCGGMDVAANVQGRAFSPSFLLVLLAGPVLGNRLWCLLALALGFEGTRRLARAIGAGRFGALLAAIVVAGNGGVFLKLGAGHLGEIPLLLVPWLLLGVRRAWDAPARGALGAGLAGALSWLEGGVYPLIWGFLIAGGWSLVASASRRSLRPLLGFLAASGATVGLSAVTLWPVLGYLPGHLRSASAPESVPALALVQALLARGQSLTGPAPWPDLPWRWHEYGAYVGPVFVAALLAGGVGAPRRALPWLLAALGFGAAALGDHGPASPWTLLNRLPILEVLRASGRLLQPALLCAALAAGVGLDRWGRWAALAPVLLALDLWWTGPAMLADAFPISLEAPSRTPFVQVLDPRHRETLVRAHYTTMTQDVLANRGILACYEPARPRIAAEPRHPRPEVFLEGVPEPVSLLSWAPGRVEVGLPDLERDAVLVMNENAAPGWRAVVDGAAQAIRPDRGRVAVQVTPGASRVTFVHRSPRLGPGLGISLGTFLLLAALAWRTRR
ncbi:MAG: hypothetical protein JXB39_07375 [Deltaproteobacteria bacterium]|nr:hypothetical protein [Deltaproteobacteria bacterium]